jgi:hypothetical protein
MLSFEKYITINRRLSGYMFHQYAVKKWSTEMKNYPIIWTLGLAVASVFGQQGEIVTKTQSAAGLYPIVDTAQTNFYNDASLITAPVDGASFYGQDGQYAGRQPSYTIRADGLTVYDNVTGLTWTRSHDWNGDGDLDSDDKMTQANAVTYVSTLNAANYGGYSDWRLPSIAPYR